MIYSNGPPPITRPPKQNVAGVVLANLLILVIVAGLDSSIHSLGGPSPTPTPS